MNPLALRFSSPEVPDMSPTELALYGQLDPVRQMVNSSIRRFVNEHRELLHGPVLDYGAGKVGTCRIPQPFRYMLPTSSYIPWEPGDNLALLSQPNAYEGILCTQVIQSVTDVQLLFRQFASILRTGGHLVLTYPVAWQEIEQELWRFTKHGIWSLCHQANLNVVDHQPLAEVLLDGSLRLALVNGLVARKA